MNSSRNEKLAHSDQGARRLARTSLPAHIRLLSCPLCRIRRARDMGWFLYVIECVDGSLYTGITVDMAARYRAHGNGKGARYTRAHPPLRLLISIPYPDRSSASREEYRVKQLSPAQKRAFIHQHLETQAALPCSERPSSEPSMTTSITPSSPANAVDKPVLPISGNA